MWSSGSSVLMSIRLWWWRTRPRQPCHWPRRDSRLWRPTPSLTLASRGTQLSRWRLRRTWPIKNGSYLPRSYNRLFSIIQDEIANYMPRAYIRVYIRIPIVVPGVTIGQLCWGTFQHTACPRMAKWWKHSCAARCSRTWRVGRSISPQRPLLIPRWLRGHWSELHVELVSWGAWRSSTTSATRRSCGMCSSKWSRQHHWKLWNRSFIWFHGSNLKRISFTNCSRCGWFLDGLGNPNFGQMMANVNSYS